MSESSSSAISNKKRSLSEMKSDDYDYLEILDAHHNPLKKRKPNSPNNANQVFLELHQSVFESQEANNMKRAITQQTSALSIHDINNYNQQINNQQIKIDTEINS